MGKQKAEVPDSRLRGNDAAVDPRVEPEDDGVAIQDDNVRHSGLDPESHLFQRRTRKRTVEEVFAAAYILYSRYHNPYTDKASDIFDTIEEIVKRKSVVQS